MAYEKPLKVLLEAYIPIEAEIDKPYDEDSIDFLTLKNLLHVYEMFYNGEISQDEFYLWAESIQFESEIHFEEQYAGTIHDAFSNIRYYEVNESEFPRDALERSIQKFKQILAESATNPQI